MCGCPGSNNSISVAQPVIDCRAEENGIAACRAQYDERRQPEELADCLQQAEVEAQRAANEIAAAEEAAESNLRENIQIYGAGFALTDVPPEYCDCSSGRWIAPENQGLANRQIRTVVP